MRIMATNYNKNPQKWNSVKMTKDVNFGNFIKLEIPPSKLPLEFTFFKSYSTKKLTEEYLKVSNTVVKGLKEATQGKINIWRGKLDSVGFVKRHLGNQKLQFASTLFIDNGNRKYEQEFFKAAKYLSDNGFDFSIHIGDLFDPKRSNPIADGFGKMVTNLEKHFFGSKPEQMEKLVGEI